MDKILEKLGLYDLTVVLLTGMIICTLTKIIGNYVAVLENIGTSLKDLSTGVFLIISYFVGIVFQEVGSIMQKHVTHRNNGVLRRAFQAVDSPNYLLSKTEKEGLAKIFKEKLKIDEVEGNETTIYNYCKMNAMEHGSMGKADTDQYISGMARSLSLYFFVTFAGALWKTIRAFNYGSLVVTVVSVFLCLLLYQRSIRLATMRYVYVLRAFYYRIVSKE